MKEFGAQEYENVAYINCDGNSEIADIFADDYDMRRVLMVIGAISKQPIMAGKTLIILDEIQELRKGITSLKYFCENAPEYHVAVAGSLLGVAMHQGESAPVGKVDILRLFPMTFEEFLMAKGDDQLLQILRSKDWKTITMLHESLTKALREYYFVGGMPEAVKTYLATNDANAVRTVQDNILFVYRSDMSKHVSPNEATRISMVWQSVPSQLAKENKKFIYGLVREGARAKDYETALLWLSDCGLVHKVSRVNTVGIPLRAYEDLKAFKLFVVDVGLLGCMAGLRQRTLLDGNDLFVEFKGALTEQYVCQQLKTIDDLDVYYYTNDRGSCEIDFVVDTGERIVPIEVKAEVNLRAKSLKTYQEKFTPEVSVRTSMADYKKEAWLVNLPLYAIDQIRQF